MARASDPGGGAGQRLDRRHATSCWPPNTPAVDRDLAGRDGCPPPGVKTPTTLWTSTRRAVATSGSPTGRVTSTVVAVLSRLEQVGRARVAWRRSGRPRSRPEQLHHHRHDRLGLRPVALPRQGAAAGVGQGGGDRVGGFGQVREGLVTRAHDRRHGELSGPMPTDTDEERAAAA